MVNFLLGCMFGAFVGILVSGLCAVAKKADDELGGGGVDARADKGNS